MSFNNEGYSTDTTLSKYVWEKKSKLKIIPVPVYQICTSLLKSFQEMSFVSARVIWNSYLSQLEWIA